MGKKLLLTSVLLLVACPAQTPPPRRTAPRKAAVRRAPPRRRAVEPPPRPLEPPETWKAYFTVQRKSQPVGRAYLGFEKNDEGSRYEVRQSVKTTWGRVTQHVTLQVRDDNTPKWLKAIEMERVANTSLRIYAQYDVTCEGSGCVVKTTRFGHRWSQKVAAGLPISRYPLLAAYYLARRQGKKASFALSGQALDPKQLKLHPFTFGGTHQGDHAKLDLTIKGVGALHIDYDTAWARLKGVKGQGALYGYQLGGKPPALIPPPASFYKVRDVSPFAWPAALTEKTLKIRVPGQTPIQGRLSLPAKGRRAPVVVLVPAADVKDWDGTHGQSRFYAQLAALLGQAGYAAFRYAPRGVAPTGGDRTQVTLKSKLADLTAIVNGLRRQRRVDRRKILLLGHAEGGIVALRYAATHRGLKGLILVSVPGVEYQAYILDQWRRRWETFGMPLKIVNQRIAWFKTQLQGAAQKGGADFLGRPGRLIADLLKLDPLQAYKRVRLRTLILAGQADSTVQTDDVNALRAGMPRNRRITVAQPENVGHLLQHSPRFLELSEMWRIPAPISPAASKPLLDWLKKNSR